MNYKLLGKILGKIMILEGVLMLAPAAVSIIYSEGLWNYPRDHRHKFGASLVGIFKLRKKLVFIRCFK